MIIPLTHRPHRYSCRSGGQEHAFCGVIDPSLHMASGVLAGGQATPEVSKGEPPLGVR